MSLEELLRSLVTSSGERDAEKAEGSGFAAGSLDDISDSGNSEAGTEAVGLLAELLGGGRADNAVQAEGRAAGVVERLGMTPGLLQAVLPLVLGRLAAARQPAVETPPAPFESGVGGGAAQGLEVDGLLERMSSEQGLDDDYVRATGMPQELAAKTGIDLPEAISVIKKILELLLGKQATTRKAKSSSSSSSKTRRATRPKSGTSASRSGTSKSSSRSKTGTSRAKKSSAKDADDKPKSTRSKSTSKSSGAGSGTKSSRSKSTSRSKSPSSTSKSRTRRSKLSGEFAGGELDDLLEKE